MSDEHTHEWSPMPGEHGRYVCACGATGYRPAAMENGLRGSAIVAHKQTKKIRGPMTHVGSSNMGEGTARRGKRGPGGW